jgi:hypothetical protein
MGMPFRSLRQLILVAAENRAGALRDGEQK